MSQLPTAATPNHALQRTAPRVTAAASHHLRPQPPSPAQQPRRAPQSLSLGSLGRMTRMEKDNAISVPDIQLQGEFTCTASPVQASGTIAQRAFYFRARHDGWSFAVALRPEVDPVDIYFPEQGFIREGSYGSGRHSDASYMALEEARRIVAECAREFFRDHAA